MWLCCGHEFSTQALGDTVTIRVPCSMLCLCVFISCTSVYPFQCPLIENARDMFSSLEEMSGSTIQDSSKGVQWKQGVVVHIIL